MKKLFKGLLFSMLTMLALSGCNNETIDEVLFKEPISHIESNQERAISTATKALQEMRQTTKNNDDEYFVKSIYPILSKRPATKALNSDTLLYLINYNDGFAIVGARNYTDQIFAISDNSQMSITDTVANPVSANLINSYANFVSDDLLNRGVSTAQSDIIVNVLEYMPPMIQAKWGQRGGFCALYTDGGPAGCVPVAVAQVCYYHKKPQSFNGYQFDWNLMQNIKKSSDFKNNPEAGQQVSRFFYEIAQNMDTKNGSTYESKIVPCFSSMGYESAYSYLDIHTVKWGILNRHEPAIICATSDAGRHAWVVDGYRETETKTPHPNGYDYVYQYDYYLHCNWGWNGIADGYYRYANSMGFFEFDTTSGAAWGGDGTKASFIFTTDFMMVYHIN